MPSSSLLKWLLIAFLTPSAWSQAPSGDPALKYLEPDVPNVTLTLPASRANTAVLSHGAPRPVVQPPALRFGFSGGSWTVTDAVFESPNVSANALHVPGKAKRALDRAVEAGRKGEWSKAETHLHEAVKHYPRYSAAIHNLGVIALLRGETARGEALIEEALSHDDTNLYSLFALAQIRLAQNDPEASLRYAERFVTLAPQEPHGLVMLAVIQVFNRRLDAALQTFDRLEKREHREIAAYHLLAGSIHELRGDAQRALVEYQKYLREAPKAANAPEVHAAVAALQTTLARK